MKRTKTSTQGSALRAEDRSVSAQSRAGSGSCTAVGIAALRRRLQEWSVESAPKAAIVVMVDRHSPRREAASLVQPVAYAGARSRMALLATAEASASSLDSPVGGRGGLADLALRVSDRFKALGAEIVILEEFRP